MIEALLRATFFAYRKSSYLKVHPLIHFRRPWMQEKFSLSLLRTGSSGIALLIDSLIQCSSRGPQPNYKNGHHQTENHVRNIFSAGATSSSCLIFTGN